MIPSKPGIKLFVLNSPTSMKPVSICYGARVKVLDGDTNASHLIPKGGGSNIVKYNMVNIFLLISALSALIANS